MLKKVNFFLILFFSSIFLLIVLLLVGYLSTPTSSLPNQTGWVDNMWSCMGDWMSGNSSNADPFWTTYGILLIVVVGVMILGIGGLTYFIIFPEMKSTKNIPQATPKQANNDTSYESVLKTLNDDERKVLIVLKNHGGKYLQKYIRNEAKLSRLKTHRVLARFAERGIVTLQKSGNTNEVLLAEWLK